MMALAIISAILILIALLRFGVIVEFSDEGFTVKAKAGPFAFLVFPKKDKPGETEKKAKRKAEKKAARKAEKEEQKRKKKEEQSERKPGGLKAFMDAFKAVKTALGRLRRRLLIKQLTLYFTSAGDDPAKTAMQFGAANAVFGAIVPVLERSFRIKRSDLRAAADFEAQEQSIYAKVIISIAVWEVLYVGFALLPVFTAMGSRKTNKKDKIDKRDHTNRKETKENGKSPN